MKSITSVFAPHPLFREKSARSLGSLSEVSDEIEYETVAEDTLRLIGLALYEENKDSPHETSIVACESVLNVDDAMSWLDCMTLPPLTDACTPKEQFQAFLRNLVRLRHLVFRCGVASVHALSTTDVEAKDFAPADLFQYVYRFNRLQRSHGMPETSNLSSRLAQLENSLRLFVSDSDCDAELLPLHRGLAQ